jgi:hypothetical protein
MEEVGELRAELLEEWVMESGGGGLPGPGNDGDWIGTVKATERGEQMEHSSVLTWKSCGEDGMKRSLVSLVVGHSQGALREWEPEGNIVS